MSLWNRTRPVPRPLPPPEALLAETGSGDFFDVGERALQLLDDLAGLRKSDRILDVGCGLGRLAWPLSGRLRGRGSYDGFDTSRTYITWCERNLGLDPARFRFHHADIRTALYNPAGAIDAGRFRFPWPDRSFDLAIATSLFTHLLPAAARNYLGEIGRMLERGGRLFATFFILDERGRAAVAEATALQPFSSPIEHGLVQDPAAPEAAVGFEADWLFETLAATGFEVAAAHPGYWKGRQGLEYQDLVVAIRRA